ncbi:hypothetical protein KC19_8G179200 [Ceratodon purpureus]|uniref:Uncharacterized protein n=1 Tax=Ceratodon purpureus TaxID=3225 RepID=A0A8T0H3D0_CERPU|nr:hypothetical protein KC19_8G179200 [Ceratodon purpureus]
MKHQGSLMSPKITMAELTHSRSKNSLLLNNSSEASISSTFKPISDYVGCSPNDLIYIYITSTASLKCSTKSTVRRCTSVLTINFLLSARLSYCCMLVHIENITLSVK